jgi:hypothetical protein
MAWIAKRSFPDGWRHNLAVGFSVGMYPPPSLAPLFVAAGFYSQDTHVQLCMYKMGFFRAIPGS